MNDTPEQYDIDGRIFDPLHGTIDDALLRQRWEEGNWSEADRAIHYAHVLQAQITRLKEAYNTANPVRNAIKRAQGKVLSAFIPHLNVPGKPVQYGIAWPNDAEVDAWPETEPFYTLTGGEVRELREAYRILTALAGDDTWQLPG